MRRLIPALLGLIFAATGAAAQPAPNLRAAQRHMVVAPHPMAAEAGREMLRAGGSALDAAIAAAVMLTLVEPQASGIGGGGLMLTYTAATRSIEAWDGRETAPAEATPTLFLRPDSQPPGTPMSFPAAMEGGRAVGVPGLKR